MILFHGCLLHASGSNLSPFNRVSVYLSLNAVDNHIRRFKRPEYIAHRDFTPIETLPDDCLLKDYPVDLPWLNGMPASALETSLDELKIAAWTVHAGMERTRQTPQTSVRPRRRVADGAK